jgi:polyhydroxybutyrate depolymerase
MALIAALIAALVVAAGFYYGYAPGPQVPRLSAQIERHGIQVGGRERTYLSYAPANLVPDAPLVIVLHGMFMNAQWIRKFTGYEFERLAEKYGFVVAYPNAHRRDWNDCLVQAASRPRRRDIDDVGFISALIEHFRLTRNIDLRRVYVVGYSHGGHMAFRLGLEAHDKIAAIASIAANLPTFENWTCKESGGTAPVMMINGTSDRLNPYLGGSIRLLGLFDHGTVQSSEASARYLAGLVGASEEADMSLLPHLDAADPTRVERSTWSFNGKSLVVLYTIRGGGHVVPQSSYRPPRLFGRVTKDINAPLEIWRFFEIHRAKQE